MYYRNSVLYYWFAERYEDAIAASKKALRINPNDITTFRNLAAIYAVLGNDKEARAAAAEVLRLDPSFTIEREFRTIGWKDREGMERFKDALMYFVKALTLVEARNIESGCEARAKKVLPFRGK